MFKRMVFALVVGMSGMVFAAPAQAHFSFFWHTHGGWGGGGNNNNNNSDGSMTTNQVETVPYTGTTHVVMLTGNGAFPEKTFAQDGDRIFFYNARSSSNALKADDGSWRSGKLDQDEGFVLLVQPGINRNFESTRSNYSGLNGEFSRETLPNELQNVLTLPVQEVVSLLGLDLSVLNDALGLLNLPLLGNLLGPCNNGGGLGLGLGRC